MTCIESGIEFTFTKAISLREHDKPAPGGEGNDKWPGVDFRIEEPSQWIWLEVKSWDPGRVLPIRRGGNQRRFVSKMKCRPFAAELRAKFYGTTAFLSWTGAFTPSKVVYVVIIQPPRLLDKALIGTFATRVRSACPKGPWTHPLSVAVMDVADWNTLYYDYPARIL